MFRYDGIFARVVKRLTELVCLNLVWLLCCIPVFTIVPSSSALYYVTLKMPGNTEGYVLRDFFRAFKGNLKQGIVLNICLIAGALVVWQDYRILVYLGGDPGKWAGIFLAAVYALIAAMLIPVNAHFENTVKQTLKNSVYLAFHHLPVSLGIVIMNGIVLYGAYISFRVMWLYLLAGGAAMALASSYMLKTLFAKYE